MFRSEATASHPIVPRARRRAGLGALLCLGCGALLGAASCTDLYEEDERARVPANQCVTCHGDPQRAGTEVEQAAPPIDLDGNTDPTVPTVGAHAVHLTASPTHGPVPCEQCHLVPTSIDSAGHADSVSPAEFTPGRVASLGDLSPSYDAAGSTCTDTYCHRDAGQVWTAARTSAEACGTCHSLPPRLPHEQSVYCADCHGQVIGPQLAFIDPSRHVNGGVDVVGECWDCHGTPGSSAPPPDLAGETDVSSLGVGAHQAHLSGGGSSRPLECVFCHEVPDEVGGIGHIDPSPNAEVIFSGVALTAGRQPVWDREQRKCTGSWCHGPSVTDESVTPAWTRGGGMSLSCSACHGMPPPDPHPAGADCTSCHSSVVSGPPGAVVVHARELHVNGQVEL